VFLDELPRLTVPTLILWGTNDMVIPSYQALAAASQLKNCRLVLIPNCGHLPHVECPDRFVAALGQFLVEHGTTRESGRVAKH
jgi:pimeloyl-ACP methyl ester carboxylesterase